jgi:2-dehydropantoate 2-reductase
MATEGRSDRNARIAVIGAGAIGSVIGGFLSCHGNHEVHFLGRSWHLDPIREHGLRIQGIWGEALVNGLHLHTDPASLMKTAPYDYVLVCVKAVDTRSVRTIAAQAAGETGIVVSLQNGLGNAESLAEVIPSERLLAGRVIFGVEIQPAVVDVTVSADDTVLGGWPSGSTSPQAEQLACIFRDAHIPARATGDIDRFLWAKLIYNCALNPLASLMDCAYGELLRTAETRDWMRRIVEECYAVGLGSGVHLEPATAEEYISLLFETLIPVTAEHHPSMLQALRMGKRTEISALNGEVVRRGRFCGIETPCLEALRTLIRAKEGLALRS